MKPIPLRSTCFYERSGSTFLLECQTIVQFQAGDKTHNFNNAVPSRHASLVSKAAFMFRLTYFLFFLAEGSYHKPTVSCSLNTSLRISTCCHSFIEEHYCNCVTVNFRAAWAVFHSIETSKALWHKHVQDDSSSVTLHWCFNYFPQWAQHLTEKSSKVGHPKTKATSHTHKRNMVSATYNDKNIFERIKMANNKHYNMCLYRAACICSFKLFRNIIALS